MNFALDSAKHNNSLQSGAFAFEETTPAGHLFVVLDFAAHDYANLEASLKARLATVVKSFVSLPDFAPDLFLGFLAKEINNFAYNLAEQSGGPDLPCSVALCFLSDDRLSYLARGDASISIFSEGTARRLDETQNETKLGTRDVQTPPSAEVQELSLVDDSMIVMMTHGVAQQFASAGVSDLTSLHAPDVNSFCDLLMLSSTGTDLDRAVVVIGGPFKKDAAIDVMELRQRLAAIESRLTETNGGANAAANLEERLGRRIDDLKEQLTNRGAAVAASEDVSGRAENVTLIDKPRDGIGAMVLRVLPIVLIAALAAGFLGGWWSARRRLKAAMPATAVEVWSVKTLGNQVTITRKDSSSRTVILILAQPVAATGEQTFSSFADVQRYIETITTASASASPAQANQTPAAPVGNGVTNAVPGTSPTSATTEAIVGPGDSLNELSRRYNTTPQRLKELNPQITRWPTIHAGQKVIVPATAGG